jgi:Tfp pilus assembly protein PilN
MTRINLLPPEQREKASREQGIMLVVLGLVAVVLVLGAVYFLTLQKVNDKQDEVDAVQAQIDTANSELDALRPYETVEKERVAMAATVKELYDSRVLWSAILEEISLVTPETIDFTQMTCDVPLNMVAGSALGGNGTVTPAGIVFTGEAGSFKDVGEFIARLGLLPQVMDPRLVNMVAVPPEAGRDGFVQFQVNVVLRPFAVPAPESMGQIETAPSPTPSGSVTP